MEKQQPGQRGDYRHFLTITTRWMDNDIYGHINNVQYYSYFDTVINRFLIDRGVLDITLARSSDLLSKVIAIISAALHSRPISSLAFE